MTIHFLTTLLILSQHCLSYWQLYRYICWSRFLRIVSDAYFSDQSPENDQSPFGSELGSEMDSEEGYDLREVSSDVEMHPDDLADVESDAR